MAAPEELKKLNTSWDTLRVLSQPLTCSCTLVVVQYIRAGSQEALRTATAASMPTSAAGIVILAFAEPLPRVTVKARVPAVVPVPNATDGPAANCPVDAPTATVKAAERVPSAKVTAGSSLTPLTADWKASVTVPLPLEADGDARPTERLPCCALAGVARVSCTEGAGNGGGGGATPVPWRG